MSSERMRKLVDEKVGWWDKARVKFTPGTPHEQSQRLEQLAKDKVREEEREMYLKKIAGG